MKKIRLNRYLAMCGVASRRKAEEVLEQGRVRVNGKIVLLPSLQIELGITEVTLDDKLMLPEQHIYLVVNKPAGYVCAVTDKYDSVIIELLPGKFQGKRIFPVGRLDRETEGIIILTNDGDFAQQMSHPSFGILKEYEVMLNEPITDKALSRWRQGYSLKDSPHWKNENFPDSHVVKPIELSKLDKGDDNNWVRVVIGEGLKREVREMVRLTGYSTELLIRTKIGKLQLTGLAPGECKELDKEELIRKINEGGEV
ncbi:MAG: rRNA pseudouridine synthase [Synergistaceae bacterium]|nr:rRNA pseudouridine synthase [Synergistaceae bacterium]